MCLSLLKNKFHLIILVVSLSAFGANSQSIFGDKIYAGGGIGSDGIEVSSFRILASANGHVGYKFTDRLSSGLRARYVFDKYRQIDIQFNHFGGGIFTRYSITKQFFASTEYEYMTYQLPIAGDFSNTERLGFDSWFIGGGFVQPMGGLLSFNLIGFYNVLYGDGTNSPYNSPFIVRAGFNYGF
ncbi:MAG: hypothetical protein ACJASO_001119 [Cyclobacteriaceae bacterium]|jgi:hypothetical protein